MTPINTDGMSASDNLLAARRFFDECWNGGRLDVVDELLAPEHVHHFADGDVVGRENVKGLIRDLRDDFPDFHISVDDDFAVEDKVVLRWTIRGTHAPTGNPVEYTGIDIIRFVDGRIVELWNQGDYVGLNRQLETQ